MLVKSARRPINIVFNLLMLIFKPLWRCILFDILFYLITFITAAINVFVGLHKCIVNGLKYGNTILIYQVPNEIF